MLAQNFKTADQLEIEPELHAAFIKLLGMLERGEIPMHRMTDDELESFHRELPLVGFNMAAWHCGTAGCLGGWAEQLCNIDVTGFENHRLVKLCYPEIDLLAVTPAQAAVALRNYLTTGWPRWREVMRYREAAIDAGFRIGGL